MDSLKIKLKVEVKLRKNIQLFTLTSSNSTSIVNYYQITVFRASSQIFQGQEDDLCIK